MKHQEWYPGRVADQIAWLLNFGDKLPGKATALGLAPALVASLVADALWLAYLLQSWLDAVRAFSHGCTQTAIAAQTGFGPLMVLPGFTAPTLPNGVTPQTEGSLRRIFTAVQDIKNGHKLTDAIAAELGIVGGVATGPDYSLLQPIISAKVNGDQIDIKWGWQGNRAWLEACELWVDRNDGKGYVFLTIDSTPNSNDSHPFPTARAIWTYKAIYRMNDRQVGQWSQTVSVTVGA